MQQEKKIHLIKKIDLQSPKVTRIRIAELMMPLLADWLGLVKLIKFKTF